MLTLEFEPQISFYNRLGECKCNGF